MARHGGPHWDVAAYALGVLDPTDAARCEAHLAECPRCAAELSALLPTSSLLADVDVESVREVTEPSFGDRILEAVRTERRRLRLRRRLTATAGTAVAAAVAGFALFAGSTWLAASPEPPPPTGAPAATTAAPTPGLPALGGPDLGEGAVLSAVDPDTGVHADVLLEETDWGTRVWFRLSSVPGPLDECRLVLVRADGSTELAGSWQVPETGYGTPEWPDPLQLPASTATERADLTELRVIYLDPDQGTETRLVTVPL